MTKHYFSYLQVGDRVRVISTGETGRIVAVETGAWPAYGYIVFNEDTGHRFGVLPSRVELEGEICNPSADH